MRGACSIYHQSVRCSLLVLWPLSLWWTLVRKCVLQAKWPCNVLLFLLPNPTHFSNPVLQPPNNPVCLSYPSIKFCFCLKETTSFYSLLPSPQIVQKPWRELLTWKSSGILAVLSNFTRFYCNLLTAGAHWHHPNFLQIYIMIST